MEKLLYRVPEAAERVGISRSKMYELLARGDVRSVYIDGARRISARALEEYVERLEATTHDPAA